MSRLIWKENELEYHQANLQKCVCYNCFNEFIVGKEIAESKELTCPFCSKKNHILKEVESNEGIEIQRNMLEELGCMGLYYYVSDGKIIVVTESKILVRKKRFLDII
jgi:hypothetical protein